ncbi:MAG: helix-turn-helix domain-containing protein [Alphaproteobacteria bacterium]|nr:helix-turn-helix domain-containing protein [Alphaproteobacteria bacterium]
MRFTSPDGLRTASADQIRAARALLHWSARELAARAGVSLPTIQRMETGGGGAAAQKETVTAVFDALETAGVVFIAADESGGAGVRFLHKRPFRILGADNGWGGQMRFGLMDIPADAGIGYVLIRLPGAPGAPLESAVELAIERAIRDGVVPFQVGSGSWIARALMRVKGTDERSPDPRWFVYHPANVIGTTNAICHELLVSIKMDGDLKVGRAEFIAVSDDIISRIDDALSQTDWEEVSRV